MQEANCTRLSISSLSGEVNFHSSLWLSMCWPAIELRDEATPFELWLNKIGILRFLPASIFGKGPLRIPFDQASFLRDGKHLAPIFQA
jgi:hypothetical protein